LGCHEGDNRALVRKEDSVDWRLYADRSRFQEVPTERLFVLQGTIRRRDGKVWGVNWHVFIETSDFDAAWASVPRPGIVVTEREIRDDPVLRPEFDEWRAGDDSAHRRFMDGVLGWTEDEDEPN
jgi:hypothetical protein